MRINDVRNRGIVFEVETTHWNVIGISRMRRGAVVFCGLNCRYVCCLEVLSCLVFIGNSG